MQTFPLLELQHCHQDVLRTLDELLTIIAPLYAETDHTWKDLAHLRAIANAARGALAHAISEALQHAMAEEQAACDELCAIAEAHAANNHQG